MKAFILANAENIGTELPAVIVFKTLLPASRSEAGFQRE
jgi:hypothetical protein